MTIVRRGKPTVFSIDLECLEILHQLCPNKKGYGLLVSELIRQEERRRAEMKVLREQDSASHDEVLVAK